MQPNETEERILDKQLDDICEGLREAIDRGVEMLQREGFSVYICNNGHSVDLQQQKPRQ